MKVETIVERVAAAPDYVAKFNAALPGKPIDVDGITQAIAAFERTIEPGLSPFDRWIGGDEAAISPAAKRGFALFNGKAGCSACHSGWRFTDDQFHDIGTSTTDLGRGREVKDAHLNYAFKTPTLRSVALRAPYMNNASVATLDDVVQVLREGRHRAGEPLAHADAVRIDRPGARRPRRLHGNAHRRRRQAGEVKWHGAKAARRVGKAKRAHAVLTLRPSS